MIMTRPKRGKDHNWELVKYDNDGAIYARCKCGFVFHIFNNYKFCEFKKDENNVLWLSRTPDVMYKYCPACGVRKKTYDSMIRRVSR